MALSTNSADRTRHDDEPTEDTPLISGAPEAPPLIDYGAPKSTAEEPEPAPEQLGKPLPKLQIFLLCYARMMEPIAFFSIFPFIAQMVQENGHLPDSDVGFYSGLIESLFSATQVVVLVFWGRLSDRIGRKPVLLYSLVGMAIAPALFGMSSSIGQMIFFRCIAGVFSGSGLIIRTMITEHSTIETQARAFSWFAFAGNVGIFIGPIIGGALADPVTQYPGAFKGWSFFERYPFALPGFVIGVISATGAITSAVFLKETLVKDDNESDDSPTPQPKPEKLSIRDILKAPGVPAVLLVYGHVMLLAFAFTAIVPVVLYTPVELGGIGFNSFEISLYMASQGASQALWLLLAFPALQYRLGTKRVMQICAGVYPFFFAGYIVVNTLLREGSHVATVFFWIIGSVVAFIGPGVAMNFTGVQLILNDVSPNPHALGTLNALALTCASAVRSIIPAVSTVIYAVGVRNQILWGHLAWAILIGLALLLPIVLQWIPDGKIPAEEHKKAVREQE